MKFSRENNLLEENKQHPIHGIRIMLLIVITTIL